VLSFTVPKGKGIADKRALPPEKKQNASQKRKASPSNCTRVLMVPRSRPWEKLARKEALQAQKEDSAQEGRTERGSYEDRRHIRTFSFEGKEDVQKS